MYNVRSYYNDQTSYVNIITSMSYRIRSEGLLCWSARLISDS